MPDRSLQEQAVVFQSGPDRLLGIYHPPREQEANTGVLIAVGGPQYRVGSHRQFVLIARDLAAAGIATLRFDYPGMGDSEGRAIGFENCERALFDALRELLRLRPGLERVVLWGLCDAASTLAMYGHQDERVAGLFLLNPWVRSEASLAETHVRQYYLRRLASRDFWRKLFRGEMNIVNTTRSAVADLGKALAGMRSRRMAASDGFPERMLRGLEQFSSPVRIVLCGQDLTALEFRQVAQRSARWQKLLAAPKVSVKELPEANHTFSRQAWRKKVVDWTVEFVNSI